MFKKQRRPTPFFKTQPPFNPISGEYENLTKEGVSPYCAMMQVAADDEYDNYVICRGFDIRIPAFVDYEEGDAIKPGISVAKPFGSRGNKTYHVGEVFPAFLPTQGTKNYVPPSPVGVPWRLGQNPGAITPTANGGQPADLTDEILPLYDHNNKAINWILIDSGGDGTRWIQFTLTSALSIPGTASATVDYDSHDDDNLGTTVTVTGIIEYDGAPGDKGVALYADGGWLVIELKQPGSGGGTTKPAFMVQGILGERPGSPTAPEKKFPAWGGDLDTAYVDDGSLVVLTPPPYTTLVPFETCTNPHGLNGEEGDTFIAIRDPDEEEDVWRLINVYSKKATIFFKFTENWSNSGGGGILPDDGEGVTIYDLEFSTSVLSWRHPGRGPEGFTGEGSTFKVQDTFLRAVNARTNDHGCAEWNAFKQCWSIIDCQHYARNIKGTTNSAPTPGAPWPCTPVTGYDGYIVAEDTHNVVVPSSWSHPGSGRAIWYRFNPTASTWDAYQVDYDCEDGE